MFKKKKAAAIVMTAMLGVSGIGGGIARNNVGAMPMVGGNYFLPDDYEVSEKEQHYLDQLMNGEIINIDAQIYDLEDSEAYFSGGCTLLMLAAYNGWLQLAWELLDLGANITLVNNGNRNAVMLAAEEKNIEMLHLLHFLRAADVVAHINDINNGPATALMEALTVGADLDIIQLLVSWGADATLNLVGANGWQSNMIGAAIEGGCDPSVIGFLLGLGANPDGKYGDVNGSLPLEEAYYNYSGGDRHIVMQLLLNAGADTATHDYSDFVGRAIVSGDQGLANLLIGFGINNPSPARLAQLQREWDSI